MRKLKTLFMLVNILRYTRMAPDCRKMSKALFKIFLRIFLNLRTKNIEFLNTYSFKNELVSYLVHP